MKNKKGITLISLVITILVLVILSAVAIYLTLGDNGILNKAGQAKNETIKQTATEKMNLKITNMQIEKYAEEQRMPTLQEFADGLCEDDEIQYVQLESKKVGSLNKIEVGEAESIFTKLKEYPYEFEINSSLQLASIDGIQVATSDTVTIPKEEYDKFKNANTYSNEEIEIGTYINGKTIYRKVFSFITPNSNQDMIIADLTSYNIDEIITMRGYTNGMSNDNSIMIRRSIPSYYASNDNIVLFVNGNDLYLGFREEYYNAGNNGCAIIEYTKTTD